MICDGLSVTLCPSGVAKSLFSAVDVVVNNYSCD